MIQIIHARIGADQIEEYKCHTHIICLSEMSEPATTNWKHRLYGWANALYSDTKRSGILHA